MTTNHRSTLRSLFTAHRSTGTDSHRQLARDLAEFSSAADLNDLNAVLARHSDAETAEIRDLVDWTRAA